MSWSAFKSSGGIGTLQFRLVIEGWPDVWVTHDALELTHSDRRAWRKGLSAGEAFTLEERVYLAEAQLEVSSASFTVNERDGNAATTSFAKRPIVLCWLRAPVDADDTTFTVSSTDAIAVDQYVHINTECIKVTAKTSSTLTVVRARWDTQAQYHYAVNDDLRIGYTPITDRPGTMRNRRVLLYVYEGADDMLYSAPVGTLVWRGRMTRPPVMQDPTRWSLQVDHIASILSQEIGSTTEEPLKIRGIYYSDDAPLQIFLQERTGDSLTDGFEAIGLDGSDWHYEYVVGYFESEDALCAQINSQVSSAIAALFTGTGARVQAVPDAVRGWFLQIEPDPTTTRLVGVFANSISDGNSDGRTYATPDGGAYVHKMVAGAVYYTLLNNASWSPGKVIGEPRATLGAGPFVVGTAMPSGNPSGGSASSNRLYLSTFPGVEIGDALSFDDPGGESVSMEVTGVDAADGWVELDVPAGRGFVLNGDTEIRHTLMYASSANIAGFRDAVVAAAPKANTGAYAHVTASDLSSWTAQAALATVDRPYATKRQYAFATAKDLWEVLSEEAKLAGGFFRLDGSGKIDFRALRISTATQAVTVAINASNVMRTIDGAPVWPRWSQELDGIRNVVAVFYGYNAVEDKHAEVPFTVRDQTSIALFKSAERLEIKPYSEYGLDFTWEDSREIAESILALFGQSYELVEIDVNWTLYDSALCGATCSITDTVLPSAADGDRGVVATLGMIVGRRWTFPGYGTLTILLHRRNYGGYAPSLRITGATLVSGYTWTLTVDQSYFADADNDTAYFGGGDYVTAWQGDSWGQLQTNGTVSGTPTATTITVVFTATPPWGAIYGAGDIYLLRFRDRAGAGHTPTAAQARFAYVADPNMLLYDGAVAREFAP